MFEAFSPGNVLRKLDPRAYQREFDKACQEAWAQGLSKIVAVLPTGGGKTFCAGEQAAQRIERAKRVLVLAHARALVNQFSMALQEDYSIWSEVEMGQQYADLGADAICMTIQSLQSRIRNGRLKPKDFDLIVIDECHRSLTDGYQSAMSYFIADWLGITATPRTSCKLDLVGKDRWQKMVIDITLKRLIKEGHLSPMLIKNFPLEISLVKSGGEWSDEEVDHAIEPYLEECARDFVRRAANECGLAFLPLVKTSKRFCELLNKYGGRKYKALHVDGEMSDDERKYVEVELLTGRINCVTNAMLWTEGKDIRPVTAILNLRPTKSWVLYTQICGRGTRLFNESHIDKIIKEYGECRWPVKKHCTLYDPLWLCDEHSLLQRPSCLFAEDDEEAEAIDNALKKQAGAIGTEEDALDLMQAVESGQSAHKSKLEARLEELSKREERLVSAVELLHDLGVNDMDHFIAQEAWERGKVTKGQNALLTKHGVPIDSVLNQGHAQQICDAIILRQRKGLAPIVSAQEAKKLGMEDAMRRSDEQVKKFIRTRHDPYSEYPA